SYGRSTLIARPAPGEWLVRAELEGYQSEEQPIVFEGDKDLTLNLELQEKSPPIDAYVNDATNDADNALVLHGPFEQDAENGDRDAGTQDGNALNSNDNYDTTSPTSAPEATAS